MSISISTMVFKPKELMNVFNIIDKCGVMLEISPAWDNSDFKAFLDDNSVLLSGVVNSFHEPYDIVEHSAKKGSPAHAKTIDLCERTLEYAQRLNARYMVYHFNNCDVDTHNSYIMKKRTYENLLELNEIAAKYSVSLLVENAGLSNNALYTEDEFVSLFDIINNACLLDIGHMNCNGWNMKNVIYSLKNRIGAYHIHNNYGIFDSHKRIVHGTIHMPHFFDYYRQYTPDACIVLEYCAHAITGAMELIEDIRLVLDFLNSKVPNPRYFILETVAS